MTARTSEPLTFSAEQRMSLCGSVDSPNQRNGKKTIILRGHSVLVRVEADEEIVLENYLKYWGGDGTSTPHSKSVFVHFITHAILR